MNRTAKRWLALLLSLLLRLAPLQGAWAGLALGGGSDMPMMDHSMEQTAPVADASMDNCADCTTPAACAMDGCASDHPCALGAAPGRQWSPPPFRD